MCEPTTAQMAMASLALSAVGTAFSAYGAIQQGQAAKAQAAYQAQIAENNRIEANQLAEDALRRGEIAEQKKREEGKQLIARQRVQLAATGQLVDEGTALDLTTDTAGLNELDALTVRNNAEREARGFRVQGINFQGEAALLRLSGANQASAARTNAFGTLIGGASQFSKDFASFKKSGAL